MSAALTNPGELLFTDEQLTLLGDLAGQAGFPGARRPELDQAAWAAVAQGLTARGVIHDDYPSAGVRLVDAVLGVVLHADRWLWVTVAHREGEAQSGQEILWLKGQLRIRQTVTSNGFHHFSTAEIGEFVSEVLELVNCVAAQAGPTHTLTEEEFELFVAAARRMLTFDASAKVGQRVEGQVLTLAEVADRLWLVEDAADGSITVRPITPAEAREQVAALAATLG